MLFSGLFKYVAIILVLLALVGSGALYVWWTSDTIKTLTTQVTALNIAAQSLQAANAAMAKDVADVKAAQDATNRNLQTIRTQSAQMSQTIQKQVLNATNPKVLQDQINNDTANTFKTLEGLSQP